MNRLPSTAEERRAHEHARAIYIYKQRKHEWRDADNAARWAAHTARELPMAPVRQRQAHAARRWWTYIGAGFLAVTLLFCTLWGCAVSSDCPLEQCGVERDFALVIGTVLSFVFGAAGMLSMTVAWCAMESEAHYAAQAAKLEIK